MGHGLDAKFMAEVTGLRYQRRMNFFLMVPAADFLQTDLDSFG